MAEAFNRKNLLHMEQSAKRMTEANYNLCLSTCNLKEAGLLDCKQNCYQSILVPYKITAHQAHSEEENLYKKCLGSKFPHVTPADINECTNNIYAQRCELFMKSFVDSAESILAQIH